MYSNPNITSSQGADPSDLPDALSSSRVFERLEGKLPVLFFDYDGTLAPIVKDPARAFMSEGMRNLLEALSHAFTVGVVSGRDLEDLKHFVNLDRVIYSGSHGYVISGPNGLHMEHDLAGRISQTMDAVETDLHKALDQKDQGIFIDRKRFAIALHYRNAEKDSIPLVFDMVETMVAKYDGLKSGGGKMVVEIKPDENWHKGKAIEWILQEMNLIGNKKVVPVFLGDDLTDEDGFLSVRENGLGILVGSHGQQTLARYKLKNVDAVASFIEEILKRKKQYCP